jgi:hypothetical protein
MMDISLENKDVLTSMASTNMSTDTARLVFHLQEALGLVSKVMPVETEPVGNVQQSSNSDWRADSQAMRDELSYKR